MHAHHQHAFASFNALTREGLTLLSRRNMLKASLAGLAGLTLPGLLQHRAEAAAAGRSVPNGKSVILLWMTGGPSHIDTWDMKPDRPRQNRGPFSPIATRIPGVFICEHLPRQAAMLDKCTLIRSVDARHSNHEPNQVFQTGSTEAAPRVNPNGRLYPAIGSVIARMRGSNHPGMPAYAAFLRSRSHLAFAGWLGRQYDPFIANQATRLPIYDLVGKDTGQKDNTRTFLSGAQLTGNFTASLYAKVPTGATYGRFRDLQASAEFDKPFGGTIADPRGVFSLAGYGQYQYDPTVLNITSENLVPGTNISLPANAQVLLGTKGWIGVAQGKIVFNISKGLSLPVALKWSNKTDLTKGNDIRGQLGLSYDLSALSKLISSKD